MSEVGPSETYVSPLYSPAFVSTGLLGTIFTGGNGGGSISESGGGISDGGGGTGGGAIGVGANGSQGTGGGGGGPQVTIGSTGGNGGGYNVTFFLEFEDDE